MFYRHKKTGGAYEILHGQASEAFFEADMTPAIIYRSLEDGKIWVRPKDEFYDGRFELVP